MLPAFEIQAGYAAPLAAHAAISERHVRCPACVLFCFERPALGEVMLSPTVRGEDR